MTTLGRTSTNSESDIEYTTNQDQITFSVYPVSISTDDLVEETTTGMSSPSTILHSNENYITDVTTVKERSTTSLNDVTTDDHNRSLSQNESYLSANESALIGSIEREIVLEVNMKLCIPTADL